MNFEWEYLGDDSWDFGEKIRGVIRSPVASVYFNENADNQRGGWIWFVTLNRGRGIAGCRGDAIREVERILGIK